MQRFPPAGVRLGTLGLQLVAPPGGGMQACGPDGRLNPGEVLHIKRRQLWCAVCEQYGGDGAVNSERWIIEGGEKPEGWCEGTHLSACKTDSGWVGSPSQGHRHQEEGLQGPWPPLDLVERHSNRSIKVCFRENVAWWSVVLLKSWEKVC